MFTRKQFKVPMLGAGLLIATLSGTAAAQGALEEIVVTAQRRTQSLQEVPISIEAVSGDEIRQQGFRNMDQLADFSPSILIDNRIQDQDIAIRGVGTTGNNQAHIRWEGSGLIQGSGNQFQVFARLSGFMFDATPTLGQTPRYLYRINSSEVGRIAPTGFYRIGQNPANIDAIRRLEVFDNANAPQFRITQAAGHYAEI